MREVYSSAEAPCTNTHIMNATRSKTVTYKRKRARGGEEGNAAEDSYNRDQEARPLPVRPATTIRTCAPHTIRYPDKLFNAQLADIAT